MKKVLPNVIKFKDCNKDHMSMVGVKNALLGEMIQAGVRVPPGFAVTTNCYRDFLENGDLKQQIENILTKVDPDDINDLTQAGKAVREIISMISLPENVRLDVKSAYQSLSEQCGISDLPVAVRSSALAEDRPSASFAGQLDTFLWVRSARQLTEKVVKCWASLFSDRAIAYRLKMGFPHKHVLISVGVQKMVNAKAAGVMFTLNPMTGDRSRIVVEANWGLGESVVRAEVNPDEFVIDKITLDIIKRNVTSKDIEYVADMERGKVECIDIDHERKGQPCMNDDELKELATSGKYIERHFGCPQAIEWAIDNNLPFPENVFILQSRPETVWSQRDIKILPEPRKSYLESMLDVLTGRN